ncbi:MAG: hypothetical protein DMG78_05140, partial [Acidobacteria bacterium]
MKQMKNPGSRRAFIKASALGLGVIGSRASALASASAYLSDPFITAPDAETKPPESDVAVWFTNQKQRFAAGPPIPWQPASATVSNDSVRLIEANKFQDILGFGGCFSDAAC